MKATDAPCPVKMPKKEAASPGSPPFADIISLLTFLILIILMAV